MPTNPPSLSLTLSPEDQAWGNSYMKARLAIAPKITEVLDPLLEISMCDPHEDIRQDAQRLLDSFSKHYRSETADIAAAVAAVSQTAAIKP